MLADSHFVENKLCPVLFEGICSILAQSMSLVVVALQCTGIVVEHGIFVAEDTLEVLVVPGALQVVLDSGII